MTTYKIDADVPLIGKHANTQFPLGKLNVGESFFVPFKDHPAGRISAVCTDFKKKHPEYNFSTRSLTEGGTRGIRVWRIEPKIK